MALKWKYFAWMEVLYNTARYFAGCDHTELFDEFISMVLYHSDWFQGHYNPRHTTLLCLCLCSIAQRDP